jgi:hypothetical protein
VNNFLSQLNLTPQERRIVVIIFLVVIVILNLLFVWPQFSAWGSINQQLDKMRGDMAIYNRLIAQDIDPNNGFQVQVKKLTSLEGGSGIERITDPQNELNRTIRDQERKTGIHIHEIGTPSTKTNEFFEEISAAVTLDPSQETNLINFLYNMGMDPAMIRVASLHLKPSEFSTRYYLNGSVTLAANYLKKPPAAAGASTSAKPAAAAHPSAAPTNKPPAKPVNKPPPAPVTAPAAKRQASPAGPPVPGPNRQPPGAGKPFMPGRVIPNSKPPPGQHKPAQTNL